MAELRRVDVAHIAEWIERAGIAHLKKPGQVAVALRYCVELHTAVPDPDVLRLYKAEAVRQWRALVPCDVCGPDPITDRPCVKCGI